MGKDLIEILRLNAYYKTVLEEGEMSQGDEICPDRKLKHDDWEKEMIWDSPGEYFRESTRRQRDA
jgi:hypothetical protein